MASSTILRKLKYTAFVLIMAGSLVRAQDSAGGNRPAQAPNETVGIRFTPGMAKAIANKMKPFLKRYEMSDDKLDAAADKIARRLMEAAHSMDGRGQELIQRFMEEQMARETEGGGSHGFLPQQFGKEFADRVLELTPAMKNFMRGFSQDVRPMMGFKQQLKFAGEMMAVKAGIDGFEQTMQKWSRGEVKELDDPFNHERKIKKDETGQSEELQSARKLSQQQIDRLAVSEWDRYVMNVKKFYGLDEAQSATADSILREFKQRAEQRKRDSAWRERYFRDRMWLNIFWRVPNGWNHPVQLMIQDDQDDAISWMEALGADLKLRLDTIPTASQRRSAEARIETAMRDKGITLEGDAK